jgi:hypothetical protein
VLFGRLDFGSSGGERVLLGGAMLEWELRKRGAPLWDSSGLQQDGRVLKGAHMKKRRSP